MKISPKYILFGIGGVLLAFIILKALDTISTNPGEDNYAFHCAKCHGDQGEGFGTLIPPLASSDWLENNLERLPCIIQNGLHEKIIVNGIVYEEQMLGIEDLTAIQIANICNYVSKEFTSSKHFYQEKEIQNLLSDCN